MRTEFSECVLMPTGAGGSLVPMDGAAATVYVCNPSTGVDSGSLVQKYADRITDIPASGITDESGNVSFYLEQGDYNIHFVDTHVPARFASYVRLFTSLSSGISADFASLNSTFLNLQSRSWFESSQQIFSTQIVESTTYAFYGDAIPRLTISGPTLLGVSYDATWSESVVGASRAAIYIDGPLGQSQLQVDADGSIKTQAAARGSGGTTNNWGKLVTCPIGLVSTQIPSYTNDTTTWAQANAVAFGTDTVAYEIGGTVRSTSVQPVTAGGICWIFVDHTAGYGGPYDYEIDVMYKVSSGTASIRDRTLRVMKAPF